MVRKLNKKKFGCCKCNEGPCIVYSDEKDDKDGFPCTMVKIGKYDNRNYVELNSPQAKAISRLEKIKKDTLMTACFILYNKGS